VNRRMRDPHAAKLDYNENETDPMHSKWPDIEENAGNYGILGGLVSARR